MNVLIILVLLCRPRLARCPLCSFLPRWAPRRSCHRRPQGWSPNTAPGCSFMRCALQTVVRIIGCEGRSLHDRLIPLVLGASSPGWRIPPRGRCRVGPTDLLIIDRRPSSLKQSRQSLRKSRARFPWCVPLAPDGCPCSPVPHRVAPVAGLHQPGCGARFLRCGRALFGVLRTAFYCIANRSGFTCRCEGPGCGLCRF